MKRFVVRCSCNETVLADLRFAKNQLQWRKLFAFGAHIEDPRAFVMRWVTLLGWMYVGGELEVNLISMRCPRCRAREKALLFQEEYDTRDA